MAAAAAAALDTPFLENKDEQGRKSVMQRAAGFHWPDPTGAALLLAGLAGCACLADRAQSGESEPAQGLSLSLSAVEPTQTRMESSSILLLVVGVVVVSALASQFIFEKVLGRVATQAVRTLLTSCSECPIELGRLRAWVFLGRLEFRNITMRSPAGYKSENLFFVRQMTVDFNMSKGLRALVAGGQPEIKALQVNGVDLVVERDSASGSNLQQAIAQLQNVKAVASKPSLCVKQVSIAGVTRVEVGESGRTSMEKIEFSDFTQEQAVSSVDGALLVVLKAFEQGLVAN